IAGLVARLEPIGEISAVSGEPRKLAVHALRDSLLIHVPAAPLREMIETYPAALLQLTRVIIRRMRRDDREQQLAAVRRIRAIAVIPATPSVDARGVAAHLHLALSGQCRPCLVDAARVDAALGPGSSDVRTDAGVAHQRLVEYLNA